jgi:hypothetical protein
VSKTNTTTRTIRGHKLTLRSGVRYRAQRPMASMVGEVFTVTILPLDAEAPAVEIPGFSYEASNAFLRAFNNGASSFAGREWA